MQYAQSQEQPCESAIERGPQLTISAERLDFNHPKSSTPLENSHNRFVLMSARQAGNQTFLLSKCMPHTCLFGPLEHASSSQNEANGLFFGLIECALSAIATAPLLCFFSPSFLLPSHCCHRPQSASHCCTDPTVLAFPCKLDASLHERRTLSHCDAFSMRLV